MLVIDNFDNNQRTRDEGSWSLCFDDSSNQLIVGSNKRRIDAHQLEECKEEQPPSTRLGNPGSTGDRQRSEAIDQSFWQYI